MRKFFITSIILSSAIITSQVFSAPKRSLNNKKRAISVRKNNISGTYNSQTNTYTPSSTSLNIIKEATTTTSTPTTCGIPASTDDVIALQEPAHDEIDVQVVDGVNERKQIMFEESDA